MYSCEGMAIKGYYTLVLTYNGQTDEILNVPADSEDKGSNVANADNELRSGNVANAGNELPSVNVSNVGNVINSLGTQSSTPNNVERDMSMNTMGRGMAINSRARGEECAT
ncbi:hypothetical protein GH714_008061 [Hevea brasiliensis]|uniref:Uncharacterized protein n=1 Tax=Hevea brasiliensis TaxID=3981 RepID=A0A6A6LHT0_HEVBR|nr:hypothetical protein GH714_008061 [Hevea brasiliensis]